MRFGKTNCVDQEEIDEALNEQRVDGNHVTGEYTDEEPIENEDIEDEYARVEAEYNLVDEFILTHLVCAKSRNALDKALSGIKWTSSLVQILCDTLNDDTPIDGLKRCGVMKEAWDKSSAYAAAMGFFVKAPRPNSSTRHGEGSVDPFVVNLGVLSIMVPSLIEATGFAEEPVKGLFTN